MFNVHDRGLSSLWWVEEVPVDYKEVELLEKVCEVPLS